LAQWPVSQVLPAGHVTHVWPLAPHCAWLVKALVTQAPASGGQQPSHVPQLPVPFV
jgi:hypothetical protein